MIETLFLLFYPGPRREWGRGEPGQDGVFLCVPVETNGCHVKCTGLSAETRRSSHPSTAGAGASDDFLQRMSQFACLKMRPCDPKSEKSIEIVLEMRKVLGKEDP